MIELLAGGNAIALGANLPQPLEGKQRHINFLKPRVTAQGSHMLSVGRDERMTRRLSIHEFHSKRTTTAISSNNNHNHHHHHHHHNNNMIMRRVDGFTKKDMMLTKAYRGSLDLGLLKSWPSGWSSSSSSPSSGVSTVPRYL